MPRAIEPDVRMTWNHLLFLHWRVEPAVMRRLIPAELDVDEFDGSAWVGLVPFRMEESRFRGVPRLPGLRDFYECNVRTYVRGGGRSGVWFFSLDAATLLPVLGGRWLWSLNYVHSRFAVTQDADVTDYRLERALGPWPSGRTRIRWRVGEAVPASVPGSLEHFLTERYWLFTKRFGRVLAGEVKHAPWSLRRAEVLDLDDSLVRAAGLRVSGEPIALAGDRLEVEGFKLRAI
jgi:uncharacterized protein YqjF (DUF2071 family)